MKRFNNFSIVLAAVLFAVSGVSVANAVTKIDGAETKSNPNRWQAITQPSGGTITISGADNASGKDITNRNIYGGYSENGENVLNNKIIIKDEAVFNYGKSLQGAASTGTSTTTTDPRLVNNNSIYITGGSTILIVVFGRLGSMMAVQQKLITTQP